MGALRLRAKWRKDHHGRLSYLVKNPDLADHGRNDNLRGRHGYTYVRERIIGVVYEDLALIIILIAVVFFGLWLIFR